MMRRVAAACFLTVFALLAAHAPDAVFAQCGIGPLRAQIEAQIEQIRLARERLSDSMTLAGMRIELQLALAEEDLAVQIERLERYREQLQEQIAAAGGGTGSACENPLQALEETQRMVSAQVAGANSFLAEISRMRENAASIGPGGTAPLSSPVGGNTPNNPPGAGAQGGGGNWGAGPATQGAPTGPLTPAPPSAPAPPIDDPGPPSGGGAGPGSPTPVLPLAPPCPSSPPQ